MSKLRVFVTFGLNLVALAGFATRAEAQAHPEANAALLQSASTAALDRLIDMGIEDLNKRNLVQIRDQAREITWQAHEPSTPLPEFVGSRESAYFRRDQRTVTVVTDEPLTREEAEILGTHEALSAAGLRDENYHLSIALYDLSNSKSEMELFANKATIVIHDVADGGTSVGGGGDTVGLSVKLQTWRHLRSQVPLWTSDRFKWLATAFEPDPNPAATHVSLTQHNGDVAISIPRERWIKGNLIVRTQIIREATAMLHRLTGIRDDYRWVGRMTCEGVRWPTDVYGVPGEGYLTITRPFLNVGKCTFSRERPTPAESDQLWRQQWTEMQERLRGEGRPL